MTPKQMSRVVEMVKKWCATRTGRLSVVLFSVIASGIPVAALMTLSWQSLAIQSATAQTSEARQSAGVAGATKGTGSFYWEQDRPCEAAERFKAGESVDPKEFDNCVYNGATFKEWRKFHESLDSATYACKKSDWKGSAQWWDVYRREWIVMNCASFRNL